MRWRRVVRNPPRASILGEYVCCLICNRKWRFSRHDGKVNVELPYTWFCSGAIGDLSVYMTGRLVFIHSFWPSSKSSLYTFNHKQVVLVSIRKTGVLGGGVNSPIVYPLPSFLLIWNICWGTSSNGFEWQGLFTYLLKSAEFVLRWLMLQYKFHCLQICWWAIIGISSAGVCSYEGLNWSWLQVN